MIVHRVYNYPHDSIRYTETYGHPSIVGLINGNPWVYYLNTGKIQVKYMSRYQMYEELEEKIKKIAVDYYEKNKLRIELKRGNRQ